MNVLILFAVFSAIFVSSALLLSLIGELCQFNHGICPNCGHRFKLVGKEKDGTRIYRCHRCKTITWVKHSWVDDYKEEKDA